MYNDNHFLSHYGVSGMKWGVRKVQKIETSRNKVIKGMKYNAENIKGRKGGGTSASRNINKHRADFAKRPISSLSLKDIKKAEKFATKLATDHGFNYIDSKKLEKGRSFVYESIKYADIKP